VVARFQRKRVDPDVVAHVGLLTAVDAPGDPS
jgi:hypothetical protein